MLSECQNHLGLAFIPADNPALSSSIWGRGFYSFFRRKAEGAGGKKMIC
jgi:hypothetical protein